MESINRNKLSYDKFPYKSKSFEQSNPNRLNCIIKALGLNSKEISNARILEIGSSYGGNIIPIAVGFENVQIVGIDLSEIQINKGKELIREMDLKNIELYAMNVLDYNNEFGKFDYIICHGVYSWVPKIVQEKILEIISSSLNENGVAHISYNTYPGWKNLDIYKNAMQFRNRTLKERGMNLTELETISFGRGMIEFIKDNTYLSKNLKIKADGILSSDNHYLYHEYYEDENNPSYLYDFNEELEKYNLFHVCDSFLQKSIILGDVSSILERECGNDFVAKEQYMDFLNNIQFRNSLVTHVKNKNKLKNINKTKFSDFSELYIRLPYSKNEIEENDTSFIRKLKTIYPNNIKIKELLEDASIDNVEIFKNVLGNKVSLESLKTNIVKKEKVKLKDRYEKYIRTLSKSNNMPIVFASKFGVGLSKNDAELELILNFNGQNNIDDLFMILNEKLENGSLKMKIEGEDRETFIKDYLEKQKEIIEYFEMVE